MLEDLERLVAEAERVLASAEITARAKSDAGEGHARRVWEGVRLDAADARENVSASLYDLIRVVRFAESTYRSR